MTILSDKVTNDVVRRQTSGRPRADWILREAEVSIKKGPNFPTFPMGDHHLCALCVNDHHGTDYPVVTCTNPCLDTCTLGILQKQFQLGLQMFKKSV